MEPCSDPGGESAYFFWVKFHASAAQSEFGEAKPSTIGELGPLGEDEPCEGLPIDWLPSLESAIFGGLEAAAAGASAGEALGETTGLLFFMKWKAYVAQLASAGRLAGGEEDAVGRLLAAGAGAPSAALSAVLPGLFSIT